MKTYYTLECGKFKYPSNAHKRIESLLKIGISSTINFDGEYYRVSINGINSIEDADTKKELLIERGYGEDTLIISKRSILN